MDSWIQLWSRMLQKLSYGSQTSYLPYHELHIILLFGNILSGKIDIDWQERVEITDIGNTRKQNGRNFRYHNFRFKKCESDFWVRACQLTNLCNDFFNSDILFKEGHKKKLLDLCFDYFTYKYNDRDPCTWRLLCGCPNCRNVKKLNVMSEIPVKTFVETYIWRAYEDDIWTNFVYW